MAAISFKLFKASCEERGYTERVYEDQGSCVLYTNNGIRCLIRKNNYAIGFGANLKDVNDIRERLLSQGFNELPGKRSQRKDGKDFVNIKFDGDILENFWIIINTIESIETIVKKVRGQAIKPIPREVSERNIFEKIAKRFKYFIDSEDGFGLENTRALLEGDSIDHLITIGESVNRTKDNTYREHIVPCILIYNQAVTMTMEKRPVTEIAQMIKNNLAIVLITTEEAAKLDYELDMQTSMPEDWKFGDDVFARLKVAGIELK
jgi:hypothetical protein